MRPVFLFFLLTFMLAVTGSQAWPDGQEGPETESQGTAADNVLLYAVFPAPPYMIGADTADGPVSGIDVDIVREIGTRMGYEIEFVRCPWVRCLDLMRNGDVDILSSAFRNPEREQFMNYLESPYLTSLPISFFSLKDSNISIESYEDLHKLETVGVLRGASYFERFDRDGKIPRYDVGSQEALLEMLVNGRIQAMAGYVPTVQYWLATKQYDEPVIQSAFERSGKAYVYMAISRHSAFVDRMDEVNEINEALLEEGFIRQTIEKYYDMYSP